MKIPMRVISTARPEAVPVSFKSFIEIKVKGLFFRKSPLVPSLASCSSSSPASHLGIDDGSRHLTSTLYFHASHSLCSSPSVLKR